MEIKLSDPIRQELLFLLGYKCFWCSGDESSSCTVNPFTQTHLFLLRAQNVTLFLAALVAARAHVRSPGEAAVPGYNAAALGVESAMQQV